MFIKTYKGDIVNTKYIALLKCAYLPLVPKSIYLQPGVFKMTATLLDRAEVIIGHYPDRASAEAELENIYQLWGTEKLYSLLDGGHNVAGCAALLNTAEDEITLEAELIDGGKIRMTINEVKEDGDENVY